MYSQVRRSRERLYHNSTVSTPILWTLALHWMGDGTYIADNIQHGLEGRGKAASRWHTSRNVFGSATDRTPSGHYQNRGSVPSAGQHVARSAKVKKKERLNTDRLS